MKCLELTKVYLKNLELTKVYLKNLELTKVYVKTNLELTQLLVTCDNFVEILAFDQASQYSLDFTLPFNAQPKI